MEEVVRYEPERKPLTAAQIKSQVQLIQEVMVAVMKEGHHYGKIPGTPKPTLYKPGAEKLLSTFRIGANPQDSIEDLSTEDEVRYRVCVKGFSQETGVLLGVGIGECSSNEEKYKWRKPVCKEEFEETPTERKRSVWKKGANNTTYKQDQIRTNPADVANTILKMAKKRALVDMTLTITAASDIFDQDLEDLPEEVRETQANGQHPPLKEPQKKLAPPPEPTQPSSKPKQPFAITEILKVKEWPPKKEGQDPTYQIVGHLNGNEQSFTTFNRDIFKLVENEPGSGRMFRLEYSTKEIQGKTYYNIISLTATDDPGPFEDAQ